MQVLYATFADNQLAGSVPVMSNITLALNMSSNRFSTVSFDAFADSLQLLYLANNSLDGTLASSLPANLTLLDVSYNDFSGPLPIDLPPGMSVLNVSHNAFNQSLPKGWGKIQSLAQLILDSNKFTGALPAEWSALGNNTDNSLQMSILDANLQGHMPQQWVRQFCLAIVRSSQPQVLFKPINISFGGQGVPLEVGPLLQLPAQHASINVSLGSKVYNFDYSSPASLCSIPNAGRNVGLVWGVFVALLLGVVVCVCLWTRQKQNPAAGVMAKLGLFKKLFDHKKLHIPKVVADKLWFVTSDVAYTVYSVVTDAITIHQVFQSGQLKYANLLLCVLLLPSAVIYIVVIAACIRVGQNQASGWSWVQKTAVLSVALVFSPVMFLLLEIGMIFHGIGIPLPTWLSFSSVAIDVYSFYRLQAFLESALNALPQSVIQTRLYIEGNDPGGIHVYIDTTLFLLSIIGSFSSILKSVAVIVLEPYQNNCSFMAYCSRLVKFEPVKEYDVLAQSQTVVRL